MINDNLSAKIEGANIVTAAQRHLGAVIDGLWYKPPVRLWFIGIRGQQYVNARRLWGRPDFAWPRATFKLLASIPPHDKVVFGDKAFSDCFNPQAL